MAEEKLCLRCGGRQLVLAHLENPIAFCLDDDDHHGRLRLGLKAILCQDCGHVELWVSDPSQIVKQREAAAASVIQEEDF